MPYLVSLPSTPLSFPPYLPPLLSPPPSLLSPHSPLPTSLSPLPTPFSLYPSSLPDSLSLSSRSQIVTLTNFALSKHLVRSNDKLIDQRGSLAYVSPDVLSGKKDFLQYMLSSCTDCPYIRKFLRTKILCWKSVHDKSVAIRITL